MGAVRRIVLLLLTLGLVLAACGSHGEPVHGFAGNRIQMRIQTASRVVELMDLDVARTPEARAQGLMGVESLPNNGGMVFLWDAPTTDAFWMKDTLIPLSVAFFDGDGRITAILDMTPCRADPCELYQAPGSYVGAIEMNRGAFERLGVKVGDTVEYTLLSE
jgi:uncharacterized membrane protein (UPF0127 family)